jgi:hypothetical protein
MRRGMSLLGLGLSLFYVAVYMPLQHAVNAVTSVGTSLGYAWVTHCHLKRFGSARCALL